MKIVSRKKLASTSAEQAHAGYHLTLEPSDKRFGVVFGGEIIAESDRVLVMHETRLTPVYYFPQEDVRMDLLEMTSHHTHCPFKGNASYWSLKIDGKTAKNVAWGYEDPYDEAEGVRNHVAFYWDAMDAWTEDGTPTTEPQATETQDGANPFVDWLVNTAWKTQEAEELVK